MRYYTFHVGPMADLSVTATVDDSAPDPGDTVTYTITAKSAGPDQADNTKVVVHLPAGVTYASDNAGSGDRTDSYDSSTGVWAVGDMAAPGEGETHTTATLTLTATVADNAARGEALDTTVEIYAIENIGTETHVRELDPNADNNGATVTVTPPAVANKPPTFYVARAIAENSAAGTDVGAVITAGDPNSGDTLTYTITGTGANLFTVDTATGGAQVKVAAGVNVNYEDASHYDLVLNVSDGKDAEGNADTAVDHYVGLRVNVTDVASETLAATLSADATTETVGGSVTFTALVTANPSPTSWLSFRYNAQNDDADNPDLRQVNLSSNVFTVTYATPSHDRNYWVDIVRDEDGDWDEPVEQITTNTVGIHWTAANSGS